MHLDISPEMLKTIDRIMNAPKVLDIPSSRSIAKVCSYFGVYPALHMLDQALGQSFYSSNHMHVHSLQMSMLFSPSDDVKVNK